MAIVAAVKPRPLAEPETVLGRMSVPLTKPPPDGPKLSWRAQPRAAADCRAPMVIKGLWLSLRTRLGDQAAGLDQGLAGGGRRVREVQEAVDHRRVGPPHHLGARRFEALRQDLGVRGGGIERAAGDDNGGDRRDRALAQERR